MHTSLLPGGQRSLFKAIKIQIKQTHKSPGQNQINSSSFCAIRPACLYIFLNRSGYIYIIFLSGTLVSQAKLVSLEPQGAIHINNNPTDKIVDLSTPLDIDINQLRDELGLGEIQQTLKILSDKIVKLGPDMAAATA